MLIAAAKAGTNISQICEEANIPRNTVQNWQRKPPKSFVVLGKLFAAIEAKTPKLAAE